MPRIIRGNHVEASPSKGTKLKKLIAFQEEIAGSWERKAEVELLHGDADLQLKLSQLITADLKKQFKLKKIGA